MRRCRSLMTDQREVKGRVVLKNPLHGAAATVPVTPTFSSPSDANTIPSASTVLSQPCPLSDGDDLGGSSGFDGFDDFERTQQPRVWFVVPQHDSLAGSLGSGVEQQQRVVGPVQKSLTRPSGQTQPTRGCPVVTVIAAATSASAFITLKATRCISPPSSLFPASDSKSTWTSDQLHRSFLRVPHHLNLVRVAARMLLLQFDFCLGLQLFDLSQRLLRVRLGLPLATLAADKDRLSLNLQFQGWPH